MKTRTLLFAALLIMSSAVSNAQIGKFLKRSVSNAAANAAERAAEKEVTKVVDSAAQRRENKIMNDTSGNNRKGNAYRLGKLLGGNANIKYNDEYNFDGRIYTEIEAYDKKEPVKSDYYIYFSNNNTDAGMEFKSVVKEGDQSTPAATTIIYDNENRVFLMLMDSKDSKTGIASTIPSDTALQARRTRNISNEESTKVDKSTGEYTPPSIVKTGNSKIIAGFKCDEYKVTEQGKKEWGLVWMTKDLKLKADKSHWSKAGLPSYYGLPEFEGSTMLAMESYDANNKLEMKMETKEINPNFKHTIVTKGYTLLKWDFNKAMKK